MNYCGQYKQDEYLDTVVFRKKTNGFFVDIGAHDGISLSNSYFFEKNRDWNGICVEPNPTVFRKLHDSRNCITVNCAVSEESGAVRFVKVSGAPEMLSGIKDNYDQRHVARIQEETKANGGTVDEIDIHSEKLSSILDHYRVKKVDFCSIDTEGSELAVLKSIDFSRVDIHCIVIEDNYNEEAIHPYLKNVGYACVGHVGGDKVYLKIKGILKYLYYRFMTYFFNRFKLKD